MPLADCWLGVRPPALDSGQTGGVHVRICVSRRGFLGLAPAIPFAFSSQAPPVAGDRPPASTFPAQDPDVVKEMVGVSHGNLARVKELVSARPALARASWDWGYGDWETADRRRVARRQPADRGIPDRQRRAADDLHRRDDGAARDREGVGGGDAGRAAQPRPSWHHAGGAREGRRRRPRRRCSSTSSRSATPTRATRICRWATPTIAAIAGEYAFGPGATERLKVAKNARGLVTIQRPGYAERNLSTRAGSRSFPPAPRR